MHMLLILLALCLRKLNGISHLFSIAYAFAGNGWQKIDTGDDTFSETEMAAVINLVNEKVAGVTAGLTTQVAELVTKVAELTANDADTDEFIDKAAAILKGGGSVGEAIAVLNEAPTG